MNEFLSVLLLSFLLDLLIGDPVYPLHPTRLIGKCAQFSERIMEKIGSFNIFGGFIFFVFVTGSVFAAYNILRLILLNINRYIAVIFYIFILYSSIALKDMSHHAQKVYHALKNNNMAKAKETVGMIVGRDITKLDDKGIVKSVIESSSENFVDGFVSVIFWYAAGGIFGAFLNKEPVFYAVMFALVFRTINTLDSMVGYKDKRYINFGKFSAKVDDAVNFIPARISIPLICLATFFINKKAADCFKTGYRDRFNHPSPNSAHAESAVSGALGIKLGGDTVYSFYTVKKPVIGKEYEQPQIKDIKESLRLLNISAVILIILIETAGGVFEFIL